MDPTKITAFLGMNNKLPPEKLSQQDGSFVVNAVNVDFTDAKTFRRRKGIDRALDGSAAHSFWTKGKEAYVVDGAYLFLVTKDASGNLVKTAIANVTPGRQFSYTRAGALSYATNGIEFFRLSGGTAVPVGITPPGEPTVTVGGDGSLPRGIYTFALSFRMGDGRDSGTSQVSQVELFSDNGSVFFPSIPAIPNGQTVLYMSPVSGDKLFEVGPVGPTHTVSVLPAEGARPVAMLTCPLPAGHIVRHLKGRLFTAYENTVFFSLPYGNELHNAASDSFAFPSLVTMIEPCVNGLYLAADKTYWLDIETMKMVEVLPYGAVLNSGNFREDAVSVWWMSSRGMCVGDQNGAVVNTQESAVAVPDSHFGASLFREEDGLKQMITSTFNSQPNTTAAKAWMEAEVTRKETKP